MVVRFVHCDVFQIPHLFARDLACSVDVPRSETHALRLSLLVTRATGSIEEAQVAMISALSVGVEELDLGDGANLKF